MGRGALWRENQQKHVRTHTHKLKPLNHFTVVPHPLSPLRFNTRSSVQQSLGHRSPPRLLLPSPVTAPAYLRPRMLPPPPEAAPPVAVPASGCLAGHRSCQRPPRRSPPPFVVSPPIASLPVAAPSCRCPSGRPPRR